MPWPVCRVVRRSPAMHLEIHAVPFVPLRQLPWPGTFSKWGGWLRPYHVKPGEFRCLAGACPRFFTSSDYGLRTTDLFKKI